MKITRRQLKQLVKEVIEESNMGKGEKTVYETHFLITDLIDAMKTNDGLNISDVDTHKTIIPIMDSNKGDKVVATWHKDDDLISVNKDDRDSFPRLVLKEPN